MSHGLSKQTITSYTGARRDLVALARRDPNTVLDVGCSAGATGRELRRQFNVNSLYGIEVNKDFAASARQFYDAVFEIDLDTKLKLPVPQQVDMLLLGDVLEHTRSPDTVLNELLTYCTQDVQVLISLPNIQHVTAIANLIAGKWPQRDRGLFDRTHLRWFTRKSILQLLHTCQLKPVVFKRKYRIFDAPSLKINRLAKYSHFWMLKDYLTYQYIILAERK